MMSDDQPLIRMQAIVNRVPGRYGAMARWQPLSLTVCVVVFLFLLVLFVVFAWHARFKSTVRVPGVLVADHGLTAVTAMVEGVYAHVYVGDGDVVRVGQVLAHISRERHEAAGVPLQQARQEYLTVQLGELHSEREQLQRDHAFRYRQLTSSIAGLKRERDLLVQEKQIGSQRLLLDTTEKQLLAHLLETGVISEAEYQRQYSAHLLTSQQMAQLRHRIAERESRLTELMFARDALELEREGTLLALEQREARLLYDFRADQQMTELSVVASGDGVISGWTAVPGDAVQAGQVLGHILPVDVQLRAMLFLPGAAAGTVASGQEVLLNYDAFPFQTHGNHQGEIVSVSQTAVDPRRQNLPLPGLQHSVYLLHAQLDSQAVTDSEGNSYRLLPGMSLQADIVTEEMRILDYILDPILRLINK